MHCAHVYINARDLPGDAPVITFSMQGTFIRQIAAFVMLFLLQSIASNPLNSDSVFNKGEGTYQ